MRSPDHILPQYQIKIQRLRSEILVADSFAVKAGGIVR